MIQPQEMQKFRESKLPYYQTLVRSQNDFDPYRLEGRVPIGATERLKHLYSQLQKSGKEMVDIEKRYRELEEKKWEILKEINELQRKINKKMYYVDR